MKKSLNLGILYTDHFPKNLTLDDIQQVYSGKPNRCMCGCSGNYYETEAMKKKVLKKMQNAEKIEVILDEDKYIFTIEENENRQYTIYTK